MKSKSSSKCFCGNEFEQFENEMSNIVGWCSITLNLKMFTKVENVFFDEIKFSAGEYVVFTVRFIKRFREKWEFLQISKTVEIW